MSGTGVQEGQGFTVAFSTLSLTLNFVDVSEDGPEVTNINCSDQGTTGYEEYLPSTLKEGGSYTFNVNWNLTDQNALYAAMGVVDTVTITWPKTLATAATDVFDGYIQKITKTAQKGSLITGVITIFKDGTGISYTDESA